MKPPPPLLQVPKDRLLALALRQGPTGAVLDLRHARRGQSGMLDEMGRVLINACQAVPQVLFTGCHMLGQSLPIKRIISFCTNIICF